MLLLSGDLNSTRDLRHYSDSTSLGRLAEESRRTFLGMDAGVERDRTVSSTFALTPRVGSWLRPRYTRTSSFLLVRDLVSRPVVRALDDTLGAYILPQTYNNTRANELGASVDLARLLRNVLGDSGSRGGLQRMLERVRPVDVSRRVTDQSTFDLAAFEPTLAYQFAVGGFEHFLGQFGEQAIGAGETRQTTISTGADLPFGLSATMSYSQLSTDRYQRSGVGFLQSRAEQREWPVGSLRYTRTFPGGPFTIFALGTAVRQRSGTQVQPSRAGAPPTVNATMSSTVTPDVQLGVRNGPTLTLSYTSLRQRNESPASLQHLGQGDWTGSVNYAIRLPESLSRTRKMLRTSVYALATTAQTCLVAQVGQECQIISDLLRREVRGTVETDLLRSLTGGLGFGYSVNASESLNRRLSQLSLSLDFQLSLFAGDYR
jgi:hypothetical protein